MKVWLIFLIVQDVTFPVPVTSNEFKTKRACEKFIKAKLPMNPTTTVGRTVTDTHRWCQEVIK